MSNTVTGRCLCGAVQFEVAGALDGPIACHCRDCQRQSGAPFWTAVTANKDDVTITTDRLAWVRITQRAWRGFCRDCGGYIFWQPVAGSTLDIALGTLEMVDALPLKAHIFTSEARLPIPEDGVPRYDAGRPGDAPRRLEGAQSDGD